jgi:PIN domain nuclease of toxin-antitoxin system
MRLLLDTHVLLWWLADDDLLADATRDSIADGDNLVVVSAATAWEIAIKQSIGRLDAPDDLLDVLRSNDFEGLSITPAHALAAGRLPLHHRDPFDRMLIAQAIAEELTVVTIDERFGHYDVELLELG